MRILEDSRVVCAFLAHTSLSFQRQQILEDYNVPANIFYSSIEEVPVLKYLFGYPVSETVYDSYMHLKRFVDENQDVFEDTSLVGLYGTLSHNAGNRIGMKDKGLQKLPVDRSERWSDIVIVIHEYGVTRRQYIDLYRLHVFDHYLAGYDQQEIDESAGTLDMLLSDIPGALIIKPDNFSSNMLYHARRTFRDITNGMITKLEYSTPSKLLHKILELIGGYAVTGMQCFNKALYTTDLEEDEHFRIDDYFYENMFKQKYVSSAWRHFFVSVLDYRAEYVYDEKNALHIEEIMDMIKRVYTVSDMTYICGLLASNTQALLNDPPSKSISDEL